MNPANNHRGAPAGLPTLDFNLHGLVHIQLVNPPAEVAAALSRQLAPALLAPAGGKPDITVRFHDSIAPPYLKYVGSNLAGFTDEDFYLLDKLSGQVTAKIPFETIGNCCEIVCDRRAGSVPLLFHLINFAFLPKNYVPLHASAFCYGGVGVVVMGWPKGGKTGALLSFMNNGAQYIGDEWVLIAGDGQKMLGVPVPVSISEWQFKYVANLLPKISAQQQLVFKSVHLLESTHTALGRHQKLKKSYPSKMLKKSLPAFKRQLKISKSPQLIFKNQMDDLAAAPEKLFLIMSHNQPDIRITPADPLELAGQMVQANLYEMRDFFELYQAFKFAFPGQKNELLETAMARQQQLLRQAFAGKETYRVLHPYGGSLDSLFDHINDSLHNRRL